MCVRNEVAAGRQLCCQLPVDAPESFLLCQNPRMRMLEQDLDISHCFIGSQRPFEHRLVSRDAQIAHYGRPAQAEDLVAPQAGIQKRTRPRMERAPRIGGVEEEIRVQGEAQELPESLMNYAG